MLAVKRREIAYPSSLARPHWKAARPLKYHHVDSAAKRKTSHHDAPAKPTATQTRISIVARTSRI